MRIGDAGGLEAIGLLEKADRRDGRLAEYAVRGAAFDAGLQKLLLNLQNADLRDGQRRQRALIDDAGDGNAVHMLEQLYRRFGGPAKVAVGGAAEQAE